MRGILQQQQAGSDVATGSDNEVAPPYLVTPESLMEGIIQTGGCTCTIYIY